MYTPASCICRGELLIRPSGLSFLQVYRLMEEKLKAMSTSLPLVGDLAHPAMRDRHWEQLMRATGKTFVKDDKFSLGDLLELGLHNYVDDCSEIVDRAQKV